MTALTQEVATLWRARALVWVLTRRELAARHAGSVAGVLWAYAQPMLTVAAYYLVFDVVFAMRLGESAPVRAVGAYLVVGAMPWMAFCEGLSRGMNSLIDAGGMLQKNALPPALFPARAVMASMLVYGPIYVLLLLAYTPLHGFGVGIGALPLLVVAQLAFTLAAGYLLAILAAALRDTVHLVGFFLSLGIFLSPVLFPLNLFPQAWQWVLYLNPMTAWVLGYQSVLLQGAWPGWGVWLPMLAWLLLVLTLLNLVVKRSRDQLVDWL